MPTQFFPSDPDLTLRITFISLVALSSFIAKALSVRASTCRPSHVGAGFWLTPLFSLTSWEKSAPLRHVDRSRLFWKGACSVLVLWAVDQVVTNLLQALDIRGWTFSYAIVLPIFFYALAGSTLIQIGSLICGRLIPAPFQQVTRAKSISAFWQRYNTWVHDGFKELIFKPLAQRPMLASFAVFAFSGLWHELLVNVPLLLICGVNLIGGWTAYFFIQWLAIVADQLFLKSAPICRRALLYLAVILPLPLVFNEGILRIFGWWRP
jgi:hypothetical protein